MTRLCERPVDEVPLAVVDLETTGLTPGVDRIVEVAVVRLEPGRDPELVLDTLVNPEQPVRATEVHGITDEEVADAPTFEEIAGALVDALADSVVAAYNVYFEARFLRYELRRVKVRSRFPHLCLMYLRPLLGLGRRAPLQEVCAEHGIEHGPAHTAAGDAQAAGRLAAQVYLPRMREVGVSRLADLSRRAQYKFLQSLEETPLRPPAHLARRAARMKSRYAALRGNRCPPASDEAVAGYWEALCAVLADLKVTPEELQYLQMKARKIGLQPEQMRMLHARLFAAFLNDAISDRWLDDAECSGIRALYRCLMSLGWAPGQ